MNAIEPLTDQATAKPKGVDAKSAKKEKKARKKPAKVDTSFGAGLSHRRAPSLAKRGRAIQRIA